MQINRLQGFFNTINKVKYIASLKLRHFRKSLGSHHAAAAPITAWQGLYYFPCGIKPHAYK